MRIEYAIKAPVAKVWWALTTAEGAEQWGAGPARFDAVEGGQFSYWGGDIHGTNAKLVREELLEQDWYGHDHPGEKYHTRFTFKSSDEGTLIQLDYSGHIYDEQRDIFDWKEYYFEPIKKLLEGELV